MAKNFKLVLVYALGLLLSSAAFAQAPQSAQSRFLTLAPPVGLPIIPVYEGWYPNADGSITMSLGYLNRNKEEALDIPIGENNFIEPAQFNGMQPTHFAVDRSTGIFTVTLPAEMVAAGEKIRWNIKVGTNDVMSTLAGKGGVGYQLDRNPRPQGSVSPYLWFEGGERGTGPDGVVGTLAQQVKVGTPVTLTVHALDPSVRDPSYPAFEKPLSILLVWYKHQGPGTVEFTRHESTVIPEPVVPQRRLPLAAVGTATVPGAAAPPGGGGGPPGFQRRPPGPESVTLPTPEGTANIIATFSAPGEYILRTRVDNWTSPDSSEGNQCCWTNAYQRITVVP